MVSPFMSFATGALQAVDKNIDRYRAEEAAEEQRADAAAQRMKELNFDRETKREIANIAAGSREKVAGINKAGQAAKTKTLPGGFVVPAKPGAAQTREFWSQLYENPEKVQAALGNADIRDNFIRAVGSFTNASAVQIGDTGTFYSATSPQAYGLLMRPEVKKIAEAFEASKPYDPEGHVPPKDKQIQSPEEKQKTSNNKKALGNAEAQIKDGGKTHLIQKNLVADKAIDIYMNRHLPRTYGNSRKQAVINFHRRIQGVSGSSTIGYQEGEDPYSAINKFYSVASSPIVKYLGREFQSSMPLGEDDKKAIEEYIRNPKHGFFDEKNNKLNADYYKMIAIYAPKSKTDTNIRGNPAVTIKKDMEAPGGKGKNIVRDTINRYAELGGIAKQARRTLSRLLEISDRTQTGSSIMNTLYGLRDGIPEFVDKAFAFARSLISGTNINIELSASQEAKLNSLIEKRKKGGVGVDAAEIEMLELVLAYQMTSVLQGGTGGRTISDTDVTRALTMLRGPANSLAQKKRKLEFLRGLLEDQTVRIDAFARLGMDTNIEQFDALYKLDREGLLSFYNLKNFDKDFVEADKAARPIGGTEFDNAERGLKLLGQSNNALIRDNYNGSAARAGITKVLENGGVAAVMEIGSNKEQPVIVNLEVRSNWRDTVAAFKEARIKKEQFEEIRERYNKDFGFEYNLVTNKLVPIKYTDDGVEPVSSPPSGITDELDGMDEKTRAFIESRRIGPSSTSGDPRKNLNALNKKAARDKLFGTR